ncbi:hypothetical protein P3X46_025213 [Hevea brasiliensis]|uniref:Protein kinase domain-containing protein n=2 Tax=Hevea brasiliensis TaxID=3981 RepID=A0ABQ9L867_HEVBR|nr:hypothetical protein P3X46_025213 [Hevea brasiliensis]
MDLCHRLPNLEILFLYDNKFIGSIPRDIGNCTMLQQLRLARNNFTGAIPLEMGNLRYLKVLRLPVNSLIGSIPPNIFNISTLEDITLAVNLLFGNLPSNLGLWLPNLKRLLLGGNELDGIIPSTIGNATKLVQLELSENLFTGTVPMTFGNLEFLQLLALEGNILINDPSTPELSFLTSLTNCKHLIVLALANNPLNGIFPPFVNLSTTLEVLEVTNCKITGMIPRGLSNLSSLISLSLSDNDLTGPIPDTFINLAKVQRLYLSGNMIQDPIPNNLCRLSNLGELRLSRNRLLGSIPSCFGNLTSLRDLQLDSNNLTSSIPFSLWSLKDMLVLNLSSNSLDGKLPSEIGNLEVIYQMDLSKNQFFGGIPSEIGGLQQLIYLSLSRNKFQGPIPGSIGSTVSLEYLDLSNNILSGVIPKSLEALSYLKYLNLSYNRLEGEIPSRGPFTNFTAQSFMHNVGLCGAPQLGFKPCNAPSSPQKSIRFLKYVLLATASAILVLAFVYVLARRWRKKENSPASTWSDLLHIATCRRFSYQELMLATNGFNESNLLGKGSWSSVYRGMLVDGMAVAVKVFNLQLEGALESFEAECEVLRNIRHRNLIKIISSCANVDFKALVMEFMPNGSLEALLHSNSYFLDMLQRLNILVDVALAMEYLHYNYSTPVVHCDIKPSNVLLDENMVAHLGDFGISKLLGESISMTQTKTLATIGYMAPEYGSQGIVSTRGDVYSYGIMLMETLTGKKPTDKMFEGEMCLKDWVLDSMQNGEISVILDSNLLNTNESDFAAKVQCVSSVMSLAVECCEESPEMRINTREVLQRLRKIKDKYEKNIQATFKLP